MCPHNDSPPTSLSKAAPWSCRPLLSKPFSNASRHKAVSPSIDRIDDVWLMLRRRIASCNRSVFTLVAHQGCYFWPPLAHIPQLPQYGLNDFGGWGWKGAVRRRAHMLKTYAYGSFNDVNGLL